MRKRPTASSGSACGRLRTTLANLADASITGPYANLRTAGPARLSLGTHQWDRADRPVPSSQPDGHRGDYEGPRQVRGVAWLDGRRSGRPARCPPNWSMRCWSRPAPPSGDCVRCRSLQLTATALCVHRCGWRCAPRHYSTPRTMRGCRRRRVPTAVRRAGPRGWATASSARPTAFRRRPSRRPGRGR